jgi:hypothetical protein
MAVTKNRIKAERNGHGDVELEEAQSATHDIYQPELVVFRAIGISPLLQNNPVEFMGKDEGDKVSTGKKSYVDSEEAELRTYRDDDGNFAHPTEAFIKALVKASSGKKVGKAFATNLMKGNVFVGERWALLEGTNGKLLTKYAIDRRSVVINKKSRVLRCRPSWSPWECSFVLEVNRALIDPKTHILPLLELAGVTVGVGDYRPEKGGSNGRFKVSIK